MTFVGRILVVIHLVLSVFFMAFAGAVYTTHANWMKKADATQKALAAAETKLRTAETELQRVITADKQKFDDMENQKREFEGLYQKLKLETAALEVESKQSKSLYDAEREVARLNADEAKDRAAESMQQREKNSQLYNSRNDVFAQLKQTEDKLFALELQRQQFEEKYAQLLANEAKYRSFLASKKLPTDPKQMTATTIPPTDVEGVVMEYRKAEKGRNEYVDISLGSDDDLRIGHILTVYSDDKYLGQIKLITVTPDRSIGLVVEKAKNTTIKRGDHVSTKL